MRLAAGEPGGPGTIGPTHREREKHMRIRWRGLELPSRVINERESCQPTYGRFIAEPFERGFRRHHRQQPPPHPAVEPRRQCRHQGPHPGHAARIQHDSRRRRRRHRHLPQPEVAHRQDVDPRHADAADRAARARRGHRRRRADRRPDRGHQQGPDHRHDDRRRAVQHRADRADGPRLHGRRPSRPSASRKSA